MWTCQVQRLVRRLPSEAVAIIRDVGSNAGGQVALTLTGGSLTLLDANTYTGATTVNYSTLHLNFNAPVAGRPSSNILSPSTARTLSAGTLQITGKTSGTNSQTLAGLTLNAGASAIMIDGKATSLTATLNGIARNPGSTLNFTLAANAAVTTSTTNASFSGGQSSILAIPRLTSPIGRPARVPGRPSPSSR